MCQPEANQSERIKVEHSKLALIAVIGFALAGCGKSQVSSTVQSSPASARKELAGLGKDFSPAAFIEAVGNDDKQAVRLFIDSGFDVNSTDAQGITGLNIAAMKGHTEMVKMLLDKGANPNLVVTSGQERGISSLMAAAASGNLQIVKLLLAKGVKVDLKDERGLSALDYAKGQTNLEVLNVLRDHGAPFVTEAALAKMLERFRFDVHAKAARSMIAHESPDRCRKFIAEQLVNFEREQRFTTNQLVEAKVCAFRTVSDVVQKSAMEESINASGAVGASDQNRETITAFTDFLRELQRDPPVQSKALITAAEMGESGIVKWLLDQHADANAKDDQGMTPLMWAALKGSGPTVNILLDAGANVNAADYNGWSATMWSASQGRIETLRMLLAKKPDLNAINKDGKTALIIARAMNQAAAAAILKDGGATE